MKNRCKWVNLKNPLYVDYHDTEWGIPTHDDKTLFELLILEGFQAGLSWECIINKRKAFQESFSNFEVEKVAKYTDEKLNKLKENPQIIRNVRKIEAARINAKIFIQIQKEFGSFSNYIWGFTKGKIVHEEYTLRTTSPLSDLISSDLKKRGMKFVGSTIIYSYLGAIGIICGHGKECDFYNAE